MSKGDRKGRISVLLTTEGTYPFSPGGVSTWCDIMVHRLASVDYTVYSVTMDPFVAQQYKLPEGTQLIRVPLWGTEEPSEHLDQMFSSTYLSKQRTSDDIIAERFLPLLRALVHEIISTDKHPWRMAELVTSLYDFFTEYDYKVSFKSHQVWEAYKDMILEAVNDNAYRLERPDVYSMLQSLGWIYRFFNVINTPVPETTITHASAAAFCGLPCVISKMKYGTPFLLTEHGIYLREQYLSLSKRGYPGFMNTFLIRLIQAIVDLNYALADQISPVCDYNTRWEKAISDRHERIQVIYNGVDHKVFTAARSLVRERPTVIAVARIDPIKDIVSMIHCADIVRSSIPNVRFIVYGAVSVPEYHNRCQALVRELGLEENFEFFGNTNDMKSAYESGDVVLLASISEAFPYSIVEAMLAGKAIVSTDVGGIPEALGDTGILTQPGNPRGLADGIMRLLANRELRAEMGENARNRALNMFTLDKSLDLYLKTYIKLGLRQLPGGTRPAVRGSSQEAERRVLPVVNLTLQTQHIYAERAYALLDCHFFEEAVLTFEKAVEAAPHSTAAPVLLAELARIRAEQQDLAQAYRILGESFTVHREGLLHRQQLLAERALALSDAGALEEAIGTLQNAIRVVHDSPAIPWFCLELSRMYEETGDRRSADLERWKYEILMQELRLA